MQNRRLSVVAVLVLCACAHTGSSNQVRIADELVFALLPPASFGASLMLTQAATIEFGAEQHELLFYTEISAEKISIVGALPSGTRLFSIVYDGQAIVSDGTQDLLSSITPEYFLADLQLTQWPLAEVANGLAAVNSCFASGSCVISETADHLQRNLNRDGQSVVSIRYGALPHYRNSTSYEHHERGYRLQVETLQVQTLTEEQP
jgi:hypothetical protein